MVECVVIESELTRFLIFKCVRKLEEMVFGARLLCPYFWIDPSAGVDRSRCKGGSIQLIFFRSNLSH